MPRHSTPYKPNPIKAYIDSMTPEKILALAARPQGVAVHRFRYRDEKIAERVRKLIKTGKLYRAERHQDQSVYKLTDAGRAALAGK